MTIKEFTDCGICAFDDYDEPVILVEVDDESAVILGEKEVWISLYNSASSETLQARALGIIDRKCKERPAFKKFFNNCSIGDKRKRQQARKEGEDSNAEQALEKSQAKVLAQPY